jgi:hypothetical protein
MGFFPLRLTAVHKRYDYGPPMAIKNDDITEKSLRRPRHRVSGAGLMATFPRTAAP